MVEEAWYNDAVRRGHRAFGEVWACPFILRNKLKEYLEKYNFDVSQE